LGLLVGWSVGLVVIGLILRVGQGAEILPWGLLAMLMPLSGTSYPVSALPGVLQPAAAMLPTTHAFAAARAVVAGRVPPKSLGWRIQRVVRRRSRLTRIALASLGTSQPSNFMCHWCR
jgi:ABC-type polysaccharide/polyol phosphate export permease